MVATYKRAFVLIGLQLIPREGEGKKVGREGHMWAVKPHLCGVRQRGSVDNTD